MKVYMLKDKWSRQYWHRRCGRGGGEPWVDQQSASVWTAKAGVVAARRAALEYSPSRADYIVIETYTLVPGGSFALVSADDWMGVYIDGKLDEQSHGFNERMMLEVLEIEHEYISADLAWLEEAGSLPENLEDVKREQAV